MNTKMNFRLSLFSVSIFSLVLFSSCIKTYKLAPSESYQGKDKEDHRKVVNNNLREVKIYNQWETAAMFDVLWMSEETRRAYVDMYCERRGEPVSKHEHMLNNQLSENESEIAFYILADVRDRLHAYLTSPNSAWAMYLDFGMKEKVLPRDITQVELEPEIRSLFGHRHSKPKFKVSYLVKFPAKDVDGTQYFSSKRPFRLVLNSVYKQCHLGWQGGQKVVVRDVKREPKDKRLCKDEDMYWL